jgi:hypothetical protein
MAPKLESRWMHGWAILRLRTYTPICTMLLERIVQQSNAFYVLNSSCNPYSMTAHHLETLALKIIYSYGLNQGYIVWLAVSHYSNT